MGKLGSGCATRRAAITVSGVDAAVAAAHQPGCEGKWAPDDHSGAAGIHPREVVATHPPQPKLTHAERLIALQERRDRHERAVPPGAVRTATKKHKGTKGFILCFLCFFVANSHSNPLKLEDHSALAAGDAFDKA